MASLRVGRNSAIGLFVDGLDLKLAKLSIKKGSVVIDELHSATLAAKLEERQVAEASAESFGESTEAFALPTGESTAGAASDNNNVLLGLLSKYPVNQYVLGYAISEPSVYYHTLENDFGLKGNKLKNRVLDELKTVRAVQPTLDAIDFFYSSDKNLICVIREDGVMMLNIIQEIKPFLGNKLPKISLLDTSDVALMNLTRANYGFAPEEVTAIIYIGAEFTRLIFMKGTDFFHFAPLLGEGFDSPNIQNTVYSRLLLEQDNMGISRINKIFLTGECRKIEFDTFLRDQLPEVEIQYLKTPYLDISTLSPEAQEQIPEYAVAIATAWKVLDSDHPAFYPVNVIPESVRELQRTFKLAWHGYLVLALVFLTSFYFTFRYNSQSREIREKANTLEQLKIKLDDNNKLKDKIQLLDQEIATINQALAVYDSLVPGSDRWNRMLERLSKGIDDLGGLWITDVVTFENGAMDIKGYALYRARIPRIAALFNNATLLRVEVKPIRDIPVYHFNINVPPQELKKETTPAVTSAVQQ